MASTVHATIIVRGLVHGVGFRYFVQREASRLGLAGYAENLVSGEVKIVAEGSRGLIEELIRVARIGPRSAQVTGIKAEWREPDHQFSGFDIR
ncbi:MAG TPA: acylphosphatase [Bacteroidota bacterium]